MIGKRNILAVCDPEEDYACRFVSYIQRKKRLPFELQVFTGIRPLMEYAAGRHIEILLISDTVMCDSLQACDIGQIIVLLSDDPQDDAAACPGVCKYQSADALIREVLDQYGGEMPLARSAGRQRRRKRIGVYSPVGRTGKTSFALTLGQILARDSRVLYLSLEGYAGLEQLLQCHFERSLGDLIYYIRQESSGLAVKISGMMQSIGNLDYLPPASSPLDIQNTSLKEWMQLIGEIEEHLAYDVLILDIGDSVDDLYTLLGRCDVIYMPERCDVMSKAKIDQFEQLLALWDLGGLADRIQRITLPYQHAEKAGKDHLEELVWGQTGDYVRRLLGKEVIDES